MGNATDRRSESRAPSAEAVEAIRRDERERIAARIEKEGGLLLAQAASNRAALMMLARMVRAS